MAFYDELAQAVASGAARVTKTKGGWLLGGAVETLFTAQGLEAVGASRSAKRGAWFLPMPDEAETARALARMERKSAAIAAALAARRLKAAKDGAKTFDRYRAAQQRKAKREIQDAYRTALLEHEAELKRVMARYEAAEDPVEAIKLGYRRDELNSVIEGLTDGLANAGAAAAAYTETLLPECAALSRNIAAWQVDNMAGLHVSRMLGTSDAVIAAYGKTSYHGKYDLKAWQAVSDRNQARKTIKAAIMRGVLTGEHPTKIASRIKGIYTGSEAGSPYKRAVRIAQTEAGRVMNEAALEQIRSCNAAGVKVRKRWDATLDSKTRDSHRKVDGEVVDQDAKFSNGLKRPGDGGAAESINCRCCITPVLDGFEPDAPMRLDNETGELVPYMRYEEWAKEGGLQ